MVNNFTVGSIEIMQEDENFRLFDIGHQLHNCSQQLTNQNCELVVLLFLIIIWEKYCKNPKEETLDMSHAYACNEDCFNLKLDKYSISLLDLPVISRINIMNN